MTRFPLGRSHPNEWNRSGKEPGMKVKVDRNLCAGVGACESTCPEVFEVRDGTSTVKVKEVPADAEQRCREAVEGCPMSAIAIVG